MRQPTATGLNHMIFRAQIPTQQMVGTTSNKGPQIQKGSFMAEEQTLSNSNDEEK